MLNFDGHDLV